MLGICPDFAFAISALSKFNSCPIIAHHSAIGRTLRYLQQSKMTGIQYKAIHRASRTFSEPVYYTDSDWASNRDSRHSTRGFVITLCGGTVSWKTGKQDVVALSTMEAEYIALTEVSK